MSACLRVCLPVCLHAGLVGGSTFTCLSRQACELKVPYSIKDASALATLFGSSTFIMLKSTSCKDDTAAAPQTERSNGGPGGTLVDDSGKVLYTFAKEQISATSGTYRACWCSHNCGSSATDGTSYIVDVGGVTILDAGR